MNTQTTDSKVTKEMKPIRDRIASKVRYVTKEGLEFTLSGLQAEMHKDPIGFLRTLDRKSVV